MTVCTIPRFNDCNCLNTTSVKLSYAAMRCGYEYLMPLALMLSDALAHYSF